MNYYEILGLKIEATDAEIKKAYRKQAMKFHPDRNQGHGNKQAEEDFKNMGVAYSVLSDPVKKREYDQTLRNKSNNHHQNFENFDDINSFAKSFFSQGGFSDFDEIFQRNARKDKHIIEINISFWEAIFGVEKKFEIVLHRNKSKEVKTIKISFPPGTADKTVFSLLVEHIEFLIHVSVLKDDKFTRDNLDLYSEIEIPFTTAALGGSIDFPHWNGVMQLQVPAGTQHDDLLRLSNCGISKPPYIGDMYLKCKISVPKKLNKKQKEILQSFATVEKSPPSLYESFKNKWKKFFD